MNLIFELTEPEHGQTHYELHDRYEVFKPRKLDVRYWLGTLDAEGAFVRSELVGLQTRRVPTPEIEDFLAQLQEEEKAPPVGEYRMTDVVDWYDREGLIESLWEAPETSEEPLLEGED